MDTLRLMCNNCYKVVVNCEEIPIDCPYCGSIETWVLKIPIKNKDEYELLKSLWRVFEN